MASVNPARLLGVADRKGALVAGMDADLVILDDDLCACATMVEGRWVSEAPV
jgi:N-acetylglucosamine-6-phosphate deacetylase